MSALVISDCPPRYFCNIEDSNLMFGMHVYLMELHILSDERSRSSFKVKGQQKSGLLGSIVFLTNTSLVQKAFSPNGLPAFEIQSPGLKISQVGNYWFPSLHNPHT